MHASCRFRDASAPLSSTAGRALVINLVLPLRDSNTQHLSQHLFYCKASVHKTLACLLQQFVWLLLSNYLEYLLKVHTRLLDVIIASYAHNSHTTPFRRDRHPGPLGLPPPPVRLAHCQPDCGFGFQILPHLRYTLQ